MRLPVLSLFILWLIYAVFGWILAEATSRLLIWELAAVLIVLMALLFTAPSNMVRNVLTGLIQSDSRAFVSVIILAFAVVILGTWFTIFIRLLVLFAAGALARLELQRLGYGEWVSFGLIVCVSLLGFGMGLGSHYYLVSPEATESARVLAIAAIERLG
ncbi:hypothetical protein [Spirulina major]|uniref:hypothetical protein n=1 Tax=Spirulina major TaxID=270636 RepID=UPI000934B083|nr:hypothetical protein [Spirulina major]